MKSILLVILLMTIIPQMLYAEEDKMFIAVMELDASGITQDESKILTERLRIELFKTGKYVILEREKMDEILKEQSFQLSGCVSTECMVQIGRLVGVKVIVGGTVGKFGDLYTVNIRMIDVETGTMLNQATFDYAGNLEKLLTLGMTRVAKQLAGIQKSEEPLEQDSGQKIGQKYILGIDIKRMIDGCIITGISSGSYAEKMGLVKGDKILKINSLLAKNLSVDQCKEYMLDGIKNNNLTLQISRNGSVRYLTIGNHLRRNDQTSFTNNTQIVKKKADVQPMRQEVKKETKTKFMWIGFPLYESILYINVSKLEPQLQEAGIVLKKDSYFGLFSLQPGFSVYFPKIQTQLNFEYSFNLGFFNDKNDIHNSFSNNIDKISLKQTFWAIDVFPIEYFTFGIGYSSGKLKFDLNDGSDFETKRKGLIYRWGFMFVKRTTPAKIGIYYSYFNQDFTARYLSIYLNYYF